jgi:UDP-N-acetyl-D-mannosaminuronate dehydrogenase
LIVSSTIPDKVDAVAILTEWEEFKFNKSLIESTDYPIFDGRSILTKSYYTIGK